MDAKKIVNIFSIVAGALITIAGIAMSTGIIAKTPEKGGFLIILGGIIVVWGVASAVLGRR